jgi:Gpi18-like mannosyltransferase
MVSYHKEGGDDMLKAERRLLEWIDRHMQIIVIIALCFLGLLIRWPLRDRVSGDAYYFLLPWYEQIKENGLSQQVGDYNLLYQALIALMAHLPLQPLYAYKLLSVVFDYFLAAGAGILTAAVVKKDKLWKGTIAFVLVLFSPLVVLNSAAWAQCDAIYSCFAVFSVLALLKQRHVAAMILLGLSFVFKLQAVFLLPLFLFVYYSRRKFSALLFLIIPLTMCAASLPSVFFGRSLSDVFLIYFNQTSSYPYMAMNYPSAWLLLVNGMSAADYNLLRVPAMIFTVVALALLMLYWLRRKNAPEGLNLLIMAFLLCYACVLFLPSMHERYGFIYEVLAIILAVLIPKTAPLCAGLIGITVCTYGSYLFGWQSLPLNTLAVINVALFVAYSCILLHKMDRELMPVSE